MPFREARHADTATRRSFIARWHGTSVGSGTVVEVLRPGSATGPRATITVRDRSDPGRTLRLEATDEYVLVLDDGEPVAVSPRIICVLDARTWSPVGCDRIGERQRVEILTLPAAPAWRPPASARVGLASYGLLELPGDHHAPPDRS
ncbi:DUF917 domain-containing protein (plasmid) [Embleya sp. NBC_00888]|uniref:S-methyl thiohydantoin desulfurase domain-containing protein n=1 Tax=Embleya sp. NBC_00888 TaxID=2975960 RepID=UPI002F916175|nr:DUF917 domain-containing protein [Embleya sp. NBC_00888]